MTHIPTQNTDNTLEPPQSLEALKLRDYCYVATLKKFVWIDDPLLHLLSLMSLMRSLLIFHYQQLGEMERLSD